MSLNSEIYAQIHALAKFALPVGTPIILGRRGKPAPSGPHLVVMPIPEIATSGQADERMVGDDLVKHFDWVGEVDIRELDGDGDLLRLLIEATESEDVETYLTTVSFLSNTTIQDMSFQEGDRWVLESRVGFRITVKTVRTERIGYLAKIGIQGSVGNIPVSSDIPLDQS